MGEHYSPFNSYIGYIKEDPIIFLIAFYFACTIYLFKARRISGLRWNAYQTAPMIMIFSIVISVPVYFLEMNFRNYLIIRIGLIFTLIAAIIAAIITQAKLSEYYRLEREKIRRNRLLDGELRRRAQEADPSWDPDQWAEENHYEEPPVAY